MQRKEAEKLLAALIFDDLDEASKTELLNYLQTDNELRERLADMRMAVKVASDTVQHGPDPVLGKRRLKHLAKLARHQRNWRTFLTTPRLAAAAAIFIIGIVGLAVLLPSLEKASERAPYAALKTKIEAHYGDRGERGSTSTWARNQAPTGTPSDSPSKRTTETTSIEGLYASYNGQVPVVVDKRYAYDPAARGPATVDMGAATGRPEAIVSASEGFTHDRNHFVGAEEETGETIGAQTSLPHGYAYLPTKPDSVEKWTSPSSWDYIPHSGVAIGGGDDSYYGSHYVRGLRGGGYGGYGTGNIDQGGGMGMMGGFGRGTGGTRYSSRSWDLHDGGESSTGFMSGDTFDVTGGSYNGDIEFRGKEINLFNESDSSAIVANVIPMGGKVEFQNGITTGIIKDGGAIDSFDVTDNDGDRRSVTVVADKPVTVTEPEFVVTPPPIRPSLTKKDVSEVSNWRNIVARPEDAESQVMREGTKNSEWRAEMRAYDHEEIRRKREELAKSYQLVPDKIKPVKPSTPGLSTVVEASRQGEISKETEEVLSHERDKKSGLSSEEYIKELLKSADGDKTKLDIIDSYFRASEGESAGKEESKRETVPMLGDIPLVGGLYHTDGKKPVLTEEAKKLITKYYFEYRKSQPEGESDISRLLTQPGFDTMLDALSTTDEQSAVDQTSIRTGEDEPDLPPASRFKIVAVNPWVMAERDSLSTFALDVDTASYTLCRRYIQGGFLPPAGAVRMEEFINYFNYQYPQRTNPTFKVHAEAAPSPFARKEQNLTLLKIGVKARTIGRDQRKAAHLIFVVDASASMDQPDRLPLVQRALSLLVNKLSAVDRVSLITCANQARLHLESAPAGDRDRIRQAINAIQPAGPTNLLDGLKLGYATARRTFAPKQINHVVLCSDGVANVGQTEAQAILEEVAADRKQGITITCVGVGYGSYNDAFLEALANQGDGSYMFLDSLQQVHRVFVEQLAATLQTVARDARIQVDFNPNRVRRYRLIGYENRDIEDKRFRDDTIDAGEVGSGQCSTALYELELVGQPSADRQQDLGTVFVRYRNVATGQFEEISSRLDSAVVRRHTVESAPRFFLAAGAARFAEILRQSEHAQHANLTDVSRVVEQVSLALPLDRDVRELAELIRKSENLPRSP